MKLIMITFTLTFTALGGFGQQKNKFHITIYGQDTSQSYKYTWMPKHDVDILKTMKLRYQKPKDFKEVPGTDCFDSIPKLMQIISCAGNQLHSNDEHFLAFISMRRPFTSQEIIRLKELFGNGLYENDKAHINQIRTDIEYAYGHQAALHWRKYVTYYSPAEAKNKFNADTAVIFSVKLDSAEYYKKKYRFFDALFLEKKERSWVSFYCFYDEAGKENLSNYMKAVESVFRYED